MLIRTMRVLAFLHVTLFVLPGYDHAVAAHLAERTDADEHLFVHDDSRCGTSRSHRRKRHDQKSHPRQPPRGHLHGDAMEFEREQAMRYHNFDNPTTDFTVDLWLKPQGGQQNPTVILGAFDDCIASADSRGWFIGLREASVKSDLRVTFTLHSASASKNTSIMSHRKIEVGRWVHITATYNGRRMELYVNEAKVAVGLGQKGIIFDTQTIRQSCDVLEIGGDSRRGFYYRGQIDKLRLWSKALSHDQLTSPANTLDGQHTNEVLRHDFDEQKPSFPATVVATGDLPRLVRSTVPDEKHDFFIRKPPCGATICDNPEVIRSYLKNTNMRGHKTLKIRVINVMEKDGKRPTVTRNMIDHQHRMIEDTFAKHNISWQLEVYPVKDSWLRSKTVLHNCETEQVGDGTCNKDCLYDITGNDGGDCTTKLSCAPEKRGNGICDPECNKGNYKWDDGDCCKDDDSGVAKTCFDPRSPNRAYISVKDYKKHIGLTNRDALNIYVVNWRDKELLGIATLPWEKDVHAYTGGVVLPPTHFQKGKQSKVLIHEIGHVLGLWHVHHGSESEMDCANDCFETFPSLELGDLCSDTRPTIRNTLCSDPSPLPTKCGALQYKNTPYNNYMSYADDACTNHFSRQQVARMHCYIDLDYQSWQTNAVPSTIPLPPRITSREGNTIKLSWIPPLGSGGDNAKNLCNECEENKMLEQYASTAYSPTPSQPNGKYAPHQATGFPDADHCKASPLSWRPDSTCTSCPRYIELGFKEAVVPTSLTIWVSWESTDAFSDIQLVYTGGEEESIGGGTAQCDSPYTKPLYVKKKVSKIRIHVSHNDASIDAVKLTSKVGHPNCSMCEPLRYVIARNPPFDTGHETKVTTTRYEDRNISGSKRYEYRVRAVTNDGLSSPYSPALVYIPAKGFCGDGKIDNGEECDDGNVRDGDGCNVQCQMEDVFRCDGRPSLCYRHDGDGVCEEFEKKTSIKDCGFYTPDGFKDQWAYNTSVNSRYKYNCSEKIVIGPPIHDLKCRYYGDGFASLTCSDAWSSWTLQDFDSSAEHWLTVSFQRPAIAAAIIVYLGFISNYNEKPTKLKFELITNEGKVKMTIEHVLASFCKENPVTIPIHQDLTKPFFKTQSIKMILKSDDVGIAAVALRSQRHFDPVELKNCKTNQLFHPGLQRCKKYDCLLPECPQLLVENSNQVNFINAKREGDTAIVQCQRGYLPEKPLTAVCNSGKWTVDGEPPLCTPVDCGKPLIPNANLDCDGTTYGKKCMYTCNQSGQQIGTGAKLECEEDGLWSEATLFCQKTCRPSKRPAHAATACRLRKSFTPGDLCKYRCDKGYTASGRTVFDKKCMKDGKWSGPRCLPIRCPVDDPNIFRWYNCTSRDLFGSVCMLTCPHKKDNRRVRCMENRVWKSMDNVEDSGWKFQMCATAEKCPLPPKLDGGPTIDCPSRRIPGTKCYLKCPKGLKPSIKRPETMNNTIIESVECSPMLKWKPDLKQIQCLTPCFKGIQDGFCDGDNNNIDCYWDGGDCCDSSAGEYGAYRSDTLCGNNCDCRDPDEYDYQNSGISPSS